MTEFPEPEGRMPGGCMWMALGLIAYAVVVCGVTVWLLAHWQAGA